MAPVAASLDDPLTRALAPPPNETAEERERRLLAEQEARKHSEQIDEEINQERLAAKKNPKPVKILLLGQSESGKSTTLKNFQLMASPKAFKTERIIWRAVIQLNVVRSIHLILDTLTDIHEAQLHLQSNPASSNLRPGTAQPHSPPDATTSRHARSTSFSSTFSSTIGSLPQLTSEHLRLKMRLSPLMQVEEALVRKLAVCASSDPHTSAHFASLTDISPARREVSVNSGGWKGRFGRMLASGTTGARDSLDAAAKGRERTGSITNEEDYGIDWDDPDDPGRLIHMCGEDMKRLWEDPIIQKVLEKQKMRLQEMSGFFLDQLDRVTSSRYIPSDDDILRARIKTLGVSEYRFTLSRQNSVVSRDWHVFDVGGHRSLRGRKFSRPYMPPKLIHPDTAAWVPYFDDMTAIIFLAPISCFDQVLAEDEHVNRLEDSVLLWNQIVSNPLLERTNIVLFLNKCDILKEKLAAGIRFGKYITSYGDRPNDFQNTSAYLKRKFQGIIKDKSPAPRPFYCHLTSVTDAKTTHFILWDVAESILRVNLEKSALIV